MSAFRLDGKRALVTGGSKGIGLAIASAYAEAGADILLVARTSDALQEAVVEVSQYGGTVHGHSIDLSDLGSISQSYGALVESFGPFDILVNNAGTTHRASAEELALDDWQRVIDLNLSAAFAKERIANKRSGRILNIASLMSFQTRPGVSAYTASKGGILQLTKALAVDWAKYNILVNAIAPGYIHTPLTEKLVQDTEFTTWVKERCPLGRWGTPQDVAQAAVFLVSEAASFITGQTLGVDGGWLARF